MNRDLEKVLEALSEQDKKLTELSNRILQSTDLTINALDGQQKLIKIMSYAGKLDLYLTILTLKKLISTENFASEL